MSLKGPGPGKYLLPPVVGYPNHDVRKQRYPQYSIGKRLGFSSKDISPGPSYKVDKLTNYGKVSVPAYSIKPRLQPVCKEFTGDFKRLLDVNFAVC